MKPVGSLNIISKILLDKALRMFNRSTVKFSYMPLTKKISGKSIYFNTKGKKRQLGIHVINIVFKKLFDL